MSEKLTLYTKENHMIDLSILIIDDSNSERLQLKAKLNRLGHQVTEADSGIKALDFLSSNRGTIDLIILDVQMPEIDGFETAQRIRKLEQQHFEEWCPIIFLSGQSDIETIAHGIDVGGDDYLTKPVDTTLLQSKIIAMQRIAMMRKKLLIAKEKLEVLAHTDELTQVSNRRHFQDLLNKEISRANRHKKPLSVLYMDLDHFKRINDTHGHKAGDTALKTVAQALKKNLREIDYIGRIGGEEFCLFLPNTDIKEALIPCERYRLMINNTPIYTASKNLNITASFGLTCLIHGEDDVDSLMQRADKALYRAKANGRNCIDVIYPWDSQHITSDIFISPTKK